jgi:hypothetical protein
MSKLMVAALALIVVCAACASTQSLDDPALVATAEYLEQNPQPTPEFLVAYPSMSNDSLCIGINQGVLGEDTDAEIFFDNQSVEIVRVWIGGSLILDGGKEYSANKTFCFSRPNLPVGLHVGMVKFTTISGAVYFYSWAFRLDEIDSVTVPVELPTLAALPSLTPSPATP